MSRRPRVVHPACRTPLDLGESLLADLAHLFFIEAREWCDGCNDFHARDLTEASNREYVSRELAYFANVLAKRRRGDDLRNRDERKRP